MKNSDRVRTHTSQKVNAKIDRQLEDRIRFYAPKSKEEITRRIAELDHEWDIERVLETNASALILLGLALGTAHHRRWFILPGVIASFLLQHALHGWCPPVPIFRRLGIRTRKEINLEKTALKALRGDFEQTVMGPHAHSALAAARA